MKRAVDILAGCVFLLLALPICLPVMAILALTGEREVFYTQERVGQAKRRFRLFKFVTMVKDSQKMGTGTVTVADDPRVLPFGRTLRKTKVNELPQILNILRGDITLVGPRPLTPKEFDYYSPEVQEKISRVPPGLTGLGSIVFRDEEAILARSNLPPLEAYRQEISPYKGTLECWYVDNRSLWLDFKLLVLTAIVVLLPGTQFHEKWIPNLPQVTDSRTKRRHLVHQSPGGPKESPPAP